MDTTLLVRIVAGALFLIILVVMIQRRRTRVK
jgi:preprotein translocase subunit SecG